VRFGHAFETTEARSQRRTKAHQLERWSLVVNQPVEQSDRDARPLPAPDRVVAPEAGNLPHEGDQALLDEMRDSVEVAQVAVRADDGVHGGGSSLPRGPGAIARSGGQDTAGRVPTLLAGGSTAPWRDRPMIQPLPDQPRSRVLADLDARIAEAEAAVEARRLAVQRLTSARENSRVALGRL